MRKLEIESLKADLAAVEGLLAQRDRNADPIGWMQFSYRRDDLRQKLEGVEASPAPASVALYFGGRPVAGSAGISARFGTNAVEAFQDLGSTRLASSSGVLSDAGPIPFRDYSELMITNVARGSFGFVLEAVESRPSADDVFPLEKTIDEVCSLIQIAADQDEQKFSEAFSNETTRVVNHVTKFLRILDESGATLRVVDDQRDFSLQRRDIELARSRVDTLDIQTSSVVVEGRLYILPSSRRFDLYAGRPEGPYSGIIAPDLFKQLASDGTDGLDRVLKRVMRFTLDERSIESKRTSLRKTYTLRKIEELPEIEGETRPAW